MKKKFLSLVLASILAFTFIATTAVCAFAAGASLTVAKVNETSSTVTVAVGISGNPGISALGVNLAFDSSLLSYSKTEVTGISKEAGMAVFGTDVGGSVRIIVEEGNSGDGTKSNGNVCLVTFKKLSTVKEGSTANFTASSISSLTYGIDGNDVEIADGSVSVSLTKAETTTKKPVETTKKPVATTKKPVSTTKKPVATTKKPVVTTKPNVVSPTLPGVTVPTTIPETTTEEMTTEEVTTEEWTTEYESYSYTAPAQTDVDEDDENKSESTKRIVAVIVVVVCVGAAAALYFTRRK